jgi:hypothetical protein
MGRKRTFVRKVQARKTFPYDPDDAQRELH